MTVDEAIDRLITIDQLPEVGPDLVQEASECMEVVLRRYNGPYWTDEQRDARKFAVSVYKETVDRAVDWNP